ncbi:hypothetical protein IVB08_10080 [Bradyrhizobium sp. 173]|uniref:FlgD immunoglobulin-like domain containing protein n=1 Tax=Bradyrhizobium sp. 173 TaxID=2782644 RepID=UPI001FF8867A|nr:FlgD immunoglobulin-like domain containing protein [Bradyrhizobium sp. 173]MCK1564306.1 hypothetical protein [Bradyrhizobium sp. 173]
MAEAALKWSPTGAPLVSQRYDDVWFFNPSVGWAVNSAGHVLKTTNGGTTWDIKFRTPILPTGRPVYLRCITWADERVGWVGTLTSDLRLYQTTDGGEHWNPVAGLPTAAPQKVCGLYAVDQSMIYGSGTNDPSDGAAVIKSSDGGNSWTAFDMSTHASNLIDIYFQSRERGWVVGGFSEKPQPTYDDVKPVILFTEDGGNTWVDRLKDMRSEFVEGTWGWKIQFLDDQLGFVSLENMTEAFILKTVDGGKNWSKFSVSGNANIEGIGFLNASNGWVGGWGDEDFASGKSSVTNDGGQSWQNADVIGRFINRFRFFGNPVSLGYAAGRSIYKFAPPAQTESVASTAVAAAARAETETTQSYNGQVPIKFQVPAGSQRATLHIWNRFGKEMRTLVDDKKPEAGLREIIWDRKDDQGQTVRRGVYIYRATVDGNAESRIFALR